MQQAFPLVCVFRCLRKRKLGREQKKPRRGEGKGVSSLSPTLLHPAFFFFFSSPRFARIQNTEIGFLVEKKIAGYCSTKALYLNDVGKMRFFAATNTQWRKQKLNNTSREKQITEDSGCAKPRLKHFVKIKISDTSV